MGLPPVTNFENTNTVPLTDDGVMNNLPALPILRNPTWGESGSNGSIHNFSVIPPARHTISMPTYPSPSDSGMGLNTTTGIYQTNGQSLQMPPPMHTSLGPESVRSPYNSAKRMRLSPQNDTFPRHQPLVPRSGFYGLGENDDVPRVQFNTSTPTFIPSFMSNSGTPAPSTVSHENEDRRISVSSLLSEDPEPDDRKASITSNQTNLTTISEPLEIPPRRGSLHQRMISYSETETYGQDRGNPDLDVPRNNDTMAISGMSPSEHSDFESWLKDADLGDGFGFGVASRDTVFAPGGYYATPVPVKIPRKLEPLPKMLSENPMNLLYFHHFLNHTARILVPHDCPENPFKTILPKSMSRSSP